MYTNWLVIFLIALASWAYLFPEQAIAALAELKRTIRLRIIRQAVQGLPEGPIMGGLPRMAIFGAITDHTAHHRGALTVYARLQGVVPPMPYGDM